MYINKWMLCLFLAPSHLLGKAGPEVPFSNPAPLQDTLNQQLTDAILVGSVDQVKNVIAAGADVNYMDHDGKTPAWLALLLGKFDIVLELLEFGAKGDIVYRGKPFAQAIFDKASPGDPLAVRCITLLLLNNIDFSQVTKNIGDIREFARQGFGTVGGKELIHQLTNRGYKVSDYIWDIAWADGSLSPELIGLCIKNGVDINRTIESQKMPALFLVIKSNGPISRDQKQIIENLLNAGVDINVIANPDGNGPQTPLDWALNNQMSDAIRILMQRGAKTYKQLQGQ